MSFWGSRVGFWALQTALLSSLLVAMAALSHADKVPQGLGPGAGLKMRLPGEGTHQRVSRAGMPMWQQPVVHEAIKYLTMSARVLTGCRGAVLSLLCDHGLVLTEDVKIWDWCCTSGTDIDPVTYDKCVAKNLPSLMWLLWIRIYPCTRVANLCLC